LQITISLSVDLLLL